MRSAGKEADVGKLSAPPMATRNTKGVTSVLPVFRGVWNLRIGERKEVRVTDNLTHTSKQDIRFGTHWFSLMLSCADAWLSDTYYRFPTLLFFINIINQLSYLLFNYICYNLILLVLISYGVGDQVYKNGYKLTQSLFT